MVLALINNNDKPAKVKFQQLNTQSIIQSKYLWINQFILMEFYYYIV